jgi:pancreatic triacylglycerol lipase
LFSLGSPNDRFAAGDAVQTQGIRTNIGNLGFSDPLAHSDFYPNWGNSQPGCGTDITGNCAHSRAHEFFAESIRSNRFVGRRCANFGQITGRNCPAGQGSGTMGGNVWSAGLNGIFFLETNGGSPFARG